MKKTTMFFALLIAACNVHAQGLYVPAGKEVFVTAGQLISVDSLILVPSSDFRITGLNDLQVRSTLVHTAPQTSIARVYRLNQPLAGFSGTVRMYYRESELAGIDESNLVVSNHDGANWSSFVTSVTRDGTVNFVQASGLSNITLGEITMSSALSPLPTHFLSVGLRPGSTGNLVQWQTTNESGCRYYYVEISADGAAWTAASPAINAVNGELTNQYEWFDAAVSVRQYYRIRLVNMDGTLGYSKMIVFNPSASSSAGWKMFPNPAVNEMTVSSTDPLMMFRKLEIIEPGGRAGMKITVPGSSTLSIDISKLASGTYFMIATFADGSTAVRQFQKL